MKTSRELAVEIMNLRLTGGPDCYGEGERIIEEHVKAACAMAVEAERKRYRVEEDDS